MTARTKSPGPMSYILENCTLLGPCTLVPSFTKLINMHCSQDNPFLKTTSILWKSRKSKTQNQTTRTNAKEKQNKTRRSFACFGYNTWYPLNKVTHNMI